MTWVKIDDGMHLNAKVRGVSLAARWAYIAAICRSGATSSDGVIRAGDLGLIDATPKLAKELVAAGLWESSSDGSFVVHDYLVYNRSRAQIEELKRTNSTNGAKRLAKRSPNGLANGLANGSEKQGVNASESLPQNARSATSADLPTENDPLGSLSKYQQLQNKVSDSLSDSLSETDEAVGRLCRLWETATGSTVTRMVGDEMESSIGEMPEEWVADAIRETGLAGVKSWRYTKTILDRWKLDGREQVPQTPGNPFKESRLTKQIAAAKERMG